ncbi:MAG TPA: hypothetical protein VKV73_05220 [Chloroflexota bacterium]|nr:hypothetical protein [Chloroflexota bacterium]
MAVTLSAPGARTGGHADAYARLEECIVSRNQRDASDVFFELVREGRPLPELLREAVRIHAPYTHVPYHQRLDDGVVKFVNNDHCLLSARATLRLTELMPAGFERLPMAQTIWYLPTGLDPWNQLLGNAPGHYTRMYKLDVSAAPPPPSVHWEDQEPLHLAGTFDERMNEWLTLVQRGEVVRAYRVFLGLFEDRANRRKLLAQLVFAGLIDVQDRMLFNRSYTTGHKAYRARATVELGNAIGWSRAHAVLYAGVPDIAVGPRWHSTYEMAANVCQALLDGRDHDFRQNQGRLSPVEQVALEEMILSGREPHVQYQLTDLLKAGKGPRQILDVIQVAAAELMVQCGAPENYSMPQHVAEYCNTLRWFLDNFDHPHQVKLLYVAASLVNCAAHNQAADPKNGKRPVRRARGIDGWGQQRLLERLDLALLARNTDESLALVSAYVRGAFDQAHLIQVLATAAAKFGNDPHNQEICLSFLEDYPKSSADDRERLLFGCVMNLTGYRKYGDPLEAYNRYASAFGTPVAPDLPGDAPPEALLLDD